MKKRVLTAILAALPLFAVAAPSVVWLNPEYDFGSFSEDLGSVRCTFRGVNVGTEPVVVLAARANCGCTVPTYPRVAVAPGDTITVDVEYQATGRPGRFSKNIYVDTSDGTKGRLKVKGIVVGNATTLASRFPIAVGDTRISNTVVPFGRATKGRLLSGSITVYNSTANPIRPKALNLPSYINAVVRPEEIPAGDQGVVSLTVATDQVDDWGTVTSGFTIQPDAEAADTARISTVMILDEDFSKLSRAELVEAPLLELSATTVDLGHMTADGGEATVEIGNSGKLPLMVRKVETASKVLDVTLSDKTVKRGKKGTLQIRTKAGVLQPGGVVDERIVIRTNDPTRAVNVIRVVGTVAK